MIFAFFTDAGDDEHDNGDDIRQHFKDGGQVHRQSGHHTGNGGSRHKEESEQGGAEDAQVRSPKSKDNKRDGEPTERLNALVCLAGAGVVDDVEQSAEGCNAGADAGGAVFIGGHIDAGGVGGGGVFTHGTQVKTGARARQHIRGDQRDDDGKKEHHAAILQRVVLPRKGETEQLGSVEILGIACLVLQHDNGHQSRAEGGHGKTGHVLVCLEGHGQKAVDRAHDGTAEKGCQKRNNDHQKAGHTRLVGTVERVQSGTAAGTSHAENTGNTEVEVTCLFGQDLARGAVEKGCAEGDRIDQIIQKRFHAQSPFLPDLRSLI